MSTFSNQKEFVTASTQSIDLVGEWSFGPTGVGTESGNTITTQRPGPRGGTDYSRVTRKFPRKSTSLNLVMVESTGLETERESLVAAPKSQKRDCRVSRLRSTRWSKGPCSRCQLLGSLVSSPTLRLLRLVSGERGGRGFHGGRRRCIKTLG